MRLSLSLLTHPPPPPHPLLPIFFSSQAHSFARSLARAPEESKTKVCHTFVVVSFREQKKSYVSLLYVIFLFMIRFA